MNLLKRLWLLGAIIVLGISIMAVILAWRAIYSPSSRSQGNADTNEPQNRSNLVEIQQEQQNEEWQAALKKIDKLSATWPTYQNTRLGIAFKYPPHIKDGTVEIIEAGNVVFVTNSASDLYAHRNDLPDASEEAILSAAKKYIGGLAEWAIVTRDVHSKADLESLVSKKGCEIGPLGTTTQSGVYNVGVVPIKRGPDDDPYGPDSSCWINWMGAFKYSSDYQRAARWDIAQEGRFMLSSSDLDDPNCDRVYECVADFAMTDSFRFIPRDGQAALQN